MLPSISLLFYPNPSIVTTAMMAKSGTAAAVALSIAVAMDSVFYERFVITPLEFIHFNVAKVIVLMTLL